MVLIAYSHAYNYSTSLVPIHVFLISVYGLRTTLKAKQTFTNPKGFEELTVLNVVESLLLFKVFDKFEISHVDTDTGSSNAHFM